MKEYEVGVLDDKGVMSIIETLEIHPNDKLVIKLKRQVSVKTLESVLTNTKEMLKGDLIVLPCDMELKVLRFLDDK